MFGVVRRTRPFEGLRVTYAAQVTRRAQGDIQFTVEIAGRREADLRFFYLRR